MGELRWFDGGDGGIRVCKSAAIEWTLAMVSVCRAVGFVAFLMHSLVAEYGILESALQYAKIRT